MLAQLATKLDHFGSRTNFCRGRELGWADHIFLVSLKSPSMGFPLTYDPTILNKDTILLTFESGADFWVGQEEDFCELFKIYFPWPFRKYMTRKYLMNTYFLSFHCLGPNTPHLKTPHIRHMLGQFSQKNMSKRTNGRTDIFKILSQLKSGIF